MRFAFVLEQARIDGTIRFAARQVRQLLARGHGVAVVCAPGTLQHEFDLADVTLVEELAPRARMVDAAALERIRRAVEGADLIVSVAGRAFGAVVAAAPNARVVLDILSNDLFVGDEKPAVAAVRDAATAGNLIAHTYTDAVTFASRYGFDPKDVLFVALPVERAAECVSYDRTELAGAGESIVLSAARLDDEHVGYFPALFEGITALRKRGYPAKLFVVGDGTHFTALKATAPPAVTFLGFRSDLDSLYRLADVYVGEGSSRLEAAAAGVPVVSSCAQEFPDLAGNALFLYGMQHGTLHAYPPSTAVTQTAFADAIELLLSDAKLARRVAARGLERVASEHAAGVYVSLLERIVAGDAPPRGSAALIAPAAVLSVAADPAEIVSAIRSNAREPDFALEVREPLSWQTYAGLPEDVWDTLADATRRAALYSGTHSASPRPLFP